MDSGIIEILRTMRNTYGEGVFYNVSRAKNLLSDLCPQLPQERIQAKNFIELNGYFMLKYAGSAYPIVYGKLVSTYMSTYRVDEQTARWIVDVFAAVLGLAPEPVTSPTLDAPADSAAQDARVSQIISGYKEQAAGKDARVVDTPGEDAAPRTSPTALTAVSAPGLLPQGPALQGGSMPYVEHTLIAADFHTVAVRRDGTVEAAGYNHAGQCEVWRWHDIVSVAAGSGFTVGLRSDGTVTAVGQNDNGQCNVGWWKDIIAIAAGARHTLGLRRDGAVLATGENKYGECNVSGWRNIIKVIAGNQCTYAIKKDKRVLARGYSKNIEYDTARLTGIVGIADANPHGALALRADGTVTKARRPMKGDFRHIRDMAQIVATPDCFIGRRRDGAVRILAYYWESSGVECSTDEWADMVTIAAGRYHVVGLRRDGTLQAAMLHTDPALDKGQCEIWHWSGLRI